MSETADCDRKKPRVLFMASQPFFEWRGSPIRLGFDVLAIARNGYAVDFLTLPVGERREVEGVRIVRAPNLVRARRVGIGPNLTKFFFDGVFLFQALWMALRHRYRLIHGVEDTGIVALIVGRLTGAKVIFEKHSDPKSYDKAGAMRSVMRAYAAVERFVMRHADAVIGTGPGLVRQVRERGGGTPAYHIQDIPSSLVEPTAEGIAAARGRMEVDPTAVLATYVGSFAAYQGIDLLFAAIPLALAASPALRFVIIGGSPEEIAARRTGLTLQGVAERVLFLGKVSPDELPCFLAASDIVLSPRVAGVNTPLKLLDYLKAGRAIVATDHEANRLILDETTAHLTALTPEAFSAGVAELANDGARRESLVRRSAELIRTTYNFGAFRRALEVCYADVLKEGSATSPRPDGVGRECNSI